MNYKYSVVSIAMAAIVLVSLFDVVSSAASASGISMGTTGPAASTSFANGQSNIFVVDNSGTLWSKSVIGGSGTWNSVGGICTSSPAAVSWGTTTRVDVFVRGSNGAVYQRTYNGGWSSWYSLGGQLAPNTGPAVASWSAGRLDVFAEGTNGALYHKWWNGATWSAWESLGGTLTASPAAASPSTGVVDVFARGSDGAVWQRAYNHGWSSWTSLGGHVLAGTGPAVSQDLWVIVQGTNNQLWQNIAGAYGAHWASVGVTPPQALSSSSPGATLTVSDHTLVCFTSTSGQVWYGIHDVTGLISQWTSAGSPP